MSLGPPVAVRQRPGEASILSSSAPKTGGSSPCSPTTTRIAERYPTIRTGDIHATGLTEGPSPPGLLDEYRAEQRAAFERSDAIADLPSIAAWRRAFGGIAALSQLGSAMLPKRSSGGSSYYAPVPRPAL